MFDFNSTDTKQRTREIFSLCRNPYRPNTRESEVLFDFSLSEQEKFAKLQALQATWKPRTRKTMTAQLIPLKTAKIIPFPVL